VTAEGVDEWAERARAWLAERLPVRSDDAASAWGCGSDDVSVFRNLDDESERAVLARLAAWQATKVDAGYGAITWPRDVGGAGLTEDHERAFLELEASFEGPGEHETLSVTVHLVAPTVLAFGTAEQRARFVRPFLRADELCCQLFSEPGAGSDLAALACTATRDADGWVIRGQKVWSSGARFAAWGELIARTDRDAPRHAGMTAFIVPMDLPGIEVRPIRQMSGGASFNEVFFDDVHVPDSARLGAEGEGWKVALATLGFERASSGSNGGVGGSVERLFASARHLGATEDAVHRQRLSACWADARLQRLTRERTASDTGPAGSIGKLLWTEGMTRLSEAASALLGPRLAADSGEWGTYAWSDHVLGAPGYRIAGGSDEMQRNIIAERVLGLPRDVRA
jgi:alkylation response protein AidB-like acyl-CoA dehydrogenase